MRHGPLPFPVVLAGARGHGRWHLENIRRLTDAGLVRLAGVCELRPLDPAELDGFPGVAQSDDLGALLDATGARIAVVCTPIATHADLALAAARRGVHLLLEKPPAPSFAEFHRIRDGARLAGTACQIGFQSLGSHALGAIARLVAEGAVGEVTGIGAAGAWARDEAYFRRAPWAGKRRLGGTDVVDGVLTNPLAHAVATALALDGSPFAEDVADIELELARANDIQADDTSCLRVTTARGTRVTAAVTLCAEEPGEPYVLVHGRRGRITFWYKQDRVLLQRAGHGPVETVHGRTDLLENLVHHLADGDELLVPPDRAGAFMRVVEAVRTAPDPRPLPAADWYAEETADGSRRRIVKGVDGLVRASAETLSLFSELEANAP
ncbi:MULTISPECIES: Gfo/Idh/MocA family protein [Streptomyces]|uniref:Oxidoreductase n=2 Tax=Streptomyces TaxID=1883 RepID=A0A100Y4G6_9ACTN|nr:MULTISPECIES: Gfo/Idh/MocA family oxidoreductase [Streptomyces]KUH37527.1 oxidoreductase [Streptomyces kanasensis]UUS30463.1 Gfo/Idh/MocA family oxidoreductase [Streptomyces changanensis]